MTDHGPPGGPPGGPPPEAMGTILLRAALAVVETVGALVVASILSLFAFGVVWITYQVGVEGYTLAEILRSVETDPESSLLIPDPENPSPPALVALLGTQAVCFVAVGWILLRLRVRREPRIRETPLALTVVLGVATGGVAVLFAAAMTRILDWLGVEVTEQAWIVSLASNEPAVFWGLAPWLVVIAPFAEEVFFRGYVFRFITSRGNLAFGIVVSSLLFAVVHLHPPLLPIYFFYGILFAGLYHWTGRLVAPVTAHFTVNLIGVIIMGMTAGQAV